MKQPPSSLSWVCAGDGGNIADKNGRKKISSLCPSVHVPLCERFPSSGALLCDPTVHCALLHCNGAIIAQAATISPFILVQIATHGAKWRERKRGEGRARVERESEKENEDTEESEEVNPLIHRDK